jgi:hypothetical protein
LFLAEVVEIAVVMKTENALKITGTQGTMLATFFDS